jgi:5-formyltetrahydrofolate cyclo-ligase
VVPLVAPVESNGPHRHLRVTPPDSTDEDAAALERMQMRRTLRSRRAGLSSQQRALAAQRIAMHVARTRWLQGSRPIGLYASRGYEVDMRRLAQLARLHRCPIYLPRITDYRQRRMHFVLETSAPRPNRHGIAEPRGHHGIAAGALSVVFMPLLGFDASGTRLGSGAGYYDRLFSYRRRRLHWHRPFLVGVAYSCQQLPAIPRRVHDVPLDAVVSEDGVRYFSEKGAIHGSLAAQD